jgi:hypothetical protein
MSIEEEVKALGQTRRRRFLQLLSAALAAPAVPGGVRYACNEIAGGKAYADAQEVGRGTMFMEFNFRDQVDLVHVFVPPGLASRATLRRGANQNECVLFASPDEITEHANGIYLTDDSRELAPHVDTIAVLDTGEAGDGSIHGHEAANGMRSPGRTRSTGNGRMPMYQNDGPSGGGNEPHNSSTPTPASLHNYHQKQIASGLRNGFTLKGIARSGVHTVYHFGAGFGKGTLILAGGMVRGGYYGDVLITGDSGGGHDYGFRAPDPVTGEPGPVQTDWRNRGLRTSSAAVWRTVMTAAQVPRSLQTQFPDAAGAEPLHFMLRG